MKVFGSPGTMPDLAPAAGGERPRRITIITTRRVRTIGTHKGEGAARRRGTTNADHLLSRDQEATIEELRRRPHLGCEVQAASEPRAVPKDRQGVAVQRVQKRERRLAECRAQHAASFDATESGLGEASDHSKVLFRSRPHDEDTGPSTSSAPAATAASSGNATTSPATEIVTSTPTAGLA